MSERGEAGLWKKTQYTQVRYESPIEMKIPTFFSERSLPWLGRENNFERSPRRYSNGEGSAPNFKISICMNAHSKFLLCFFLQLCLGLRLAVDLGRLMLLMRMNMMMMKRRSFSVET